MRRYVYLMKLRPPGPGCQPMDGLISADPEPRIVVGHRFWGTLAYNRMLTKNEEAEYELEYYQTIEKEIEE